YYRPEYTTITVVGDVTHERALSLVKQYFGNWQRGNYVPDIPSEPAQDAPREAHVDWPNPTLPYVVVAFRAPAYSDENKDKHALAFSLRLRARHEQQRSDCRDARVLHRAAPHAGDTQ